MEEDKKLRVDDIAYYKNSIDLNFNWLKGLFVMIPAVTLLAYFYGMVFVFLDTIFGGELLFIVKIVVDAVYLCAFGIVGYWVNRFLEIRDKRSIMLSGCVYGLLALYCSWVFFLGELGQRNPGGLFFPGEFSVAINDLLEHGWFYFEGEMITGFMLWGAWLVEAAAIIGAPAYLYLKLSRDNLYCETCQKWCDEYIFTGVFAYFDEEQLQKSVIAQDFSFLEGVQLAQEDEIGYQISGNCCETCNEIFAVTLSKLPFELNDDGEYERKDGCDTTILAHHLKIDQAIFNQLRNGEYNNHDDENEDEGLIEEHIAEPVDDLSVTDEEKKVETKVVSDVPADGKLHLEELITRFNQTYSGKKSKKVFVGEEITEKILTKHLKKYLKLNPDEQPLLLVNMFKHSKKSALVLTDQKLHWMLMKTKNKKGRHLLKAGDSLALASDQKKGISGAYIGHQFELNGENIGYIQLTTGFGLTGAGKIDNKVDKSAVLFLRKLFQFLGDEGPFTTKDISKKDKNSGHKVFGVLEDIKDILS